MALDIIIAEVAAILGAVPGIGRVHDYVRGLTTDQDFRDACIDEQTKTLLAWMITREDTGSEQDGVHSTRDKHRIVIRGYMGVSDKVESEKAFQALIETIRATFKQKRDLNGKVYWCEPVNLRGPVMGMFRGVLVHYCELVMIAEEYPA